MTIERKIQVATGVLIVFVVGIGAVLIWTSDRVEDGVRTLRASSRVVEAVFMMHLLMDEYLVHGGRRPLRQWQAYEAQLGKILDNKEIFAPIDRKLLTNLERGHHEVRSLSPQVIEARAWPEAEKDPQEMKVLRETLAGVMSLRLEQLVKSATELEEACQVLTINRRRSVRALIVVMVVSTVFVVPAYLYMIKKSVFPQLKELTRGAEAIGSGNLDYVVQVKGEDELGTLARSFNVMVEHLKKSYESLEAEIGGRKRAQEDLVRSNKDLEQFAYVASHDLQEPLRNVASCMQMLDRKYQGQLDAEGAQLIRYAVESVTRMKALINDLLVYSRISTRGSPFQLTNFEEVFAETFTNLSPSVEQTGAVITHDPLPRAAADPTQAMQVFQNLIGNALKFRGEGPPHIHVSAVRDDSDWVFSIKDNGIGIEPRHWERIFVIFQRLHKRNEYEGTGIGLAIVKKIIERHRGRVWVKSEPGKGTTFYFTIPAKESN